MRLVTFVTGAAIAGVAAIACTTFGTDSGAGARPEVEAGSPSSPAGLDAGDRDAPRDPGDVPIADGEAPPAVGCAGDAACERVIFVTSDTYTGDLGGLIGADAKCNMLAGRSGHPRIAGRRFRAWLSLSTTVSDTGGDRVLGRMVHGTAPYVRPDAKRLAPSFAVLVDGTSGTAAAVDHDENGLPIEGGAPVWTGTSAYGVPSGSSCGAWDASAAPDFGNTGEANTPGTPWTANTPLPCSLPARLYCVEE